MAGNRNRTAGHNFERFVCAAYKLMGFNARTSRYASREKDDELVDLVGTEPFNVQCKFTKNAPNMHELLKQMPKDLNHNVVYHKRKNRGVTVTMMMEDWHEIVRMLKREAII